MNWHRLLTWIAIIAAWVIFACLCIGCGPKPSQKEPEQIRIHADKMKRYNPMDFDKHIPAYILEVTDFENRYNK